MAHDEYIEVCNRDLSCMPEVRSLVGRIRQGNLVGPAKRCRRMVEQFYSPNTDISDPESKALRSSSGSKGNQHLEKDLLFEVVNLLLGGVSVPSNRVVEKDTVSCLSSKITTKLRREKLNEQMTYRGDDETTRLYNSVSHVQDAVRGERAVDVDKDEVFGVSNEADTEDSERVMESLEIEDEIDDSPDDEADDDEDGAINDKNCTTK